MHNLVVVCCQSSTPSWISVAVELATDLFGLNNKWRGRWSLVVVNLWPHKYSWRWRTDQNKTRASFYVWKYLLAAALSKRKMQVTRPPSCSSTAPIPSSNVSVVNIVGLFGSNRTNVGLSAMSLIKLYRLLSHSPVHHHSCDEWGQNNGHALVANSGIDISVTSVIITASGAREPVGNWSHWFWRQGILARMQWPKLGFTDENIPLDQPIG